MNAPQNRLYVLHAVLCDEVRRRGLPAGWTSSESMISSSYLSQGPSS